MSFTARERLKHRQAILTKKDGAERLTFDYVERLHTCTNHYWISDTGSGLPMSCSLCGYCPTCGATWECLLGPRPEETPCG